MMKVLLEHWVMIIPDYLLTPDLHTITALSSLWKLFS
jgi:hypothetical protein